MYECGIRFVTLRDKGRLRVFEKGVLRKKLWLKRDEVIGEWRKVHNEEIYAILLLTKYY